MPKRILAIDQVETPDIDILGRVWYGDFKLICTVYASDPVKLQMRVESEWITVNSNDIDIQLKKKGAVSDVTLAHDIDYKVITETQGAEVFISKIDPHR